MTKKKKKKRKGGKVSPSAANYELAAQNKKKGELDPRKIEGYTCAKTVGTGTCFLRCTYRRQSVLSVNVNWERMQEMLNTGTDSRELPSFSVTCSFKGIPKAFTSRLSRRMTDF